MTRLKPTPEKYCAACDKRLERKRFASGRLEDCAIFARRLYCDRQCMARGFEMKPKTDDPSWMTAHYHARKLKPSGPCERCGNSRNVDVHHVNGDWQNNALGNLERLCRRCHYREHNPLRTCSLCDAPHKGRGYCEMHLQRFKKHGDPHLVMTPAGLKHKP